MAEPRASRRAPWAGRAFLCCIATLVLPACHPQSSGGPSERADPIATGNHVYLEKCEICHGEAGTGAAAQFPPLARAPWVNGPPSRLVALVLDGVTGKQTIDGREYNQVMPAWRDVLTAPEIAAVLTYVRQAWGNKSPAVSVEFVEHVRDQFAARNGFWTPSELQAFPDN